MLEQLIYFTAGILILALVLGWVRYRDVFHPLVLISPMMAFMYVYMPYYLIQEGRIFEFVTVEQAEMFQSIVLISLLVFVLGCLIGSGTNPKDTWFQPVVFDSDAVRQGGYILGAVGVFAWFYVMQNAGGIGAFMRAKATGWSDNAYIREAAYLMIVGLLLLLSPQGMARRDRLWYAMVLLFPSPI